MWAVLKVPCSEPWLFTAAGWASELQGCWLAGLSWRLWTEATCDLCHMGLSPQLMPALAKTCKCIESRSKHRTEINQFFCDPLLSAALFDWGTHTNWERLANSKGGLSLAVTLKVHSSLSLWLVTSFWGFPGHLLPPAVLSFCFLAHNTQYRHEADNGVLLKKGQWTLS